jgi:hypothetical protein
MARKLGGVDDTSVVPARGQVVVVRNDPEIMTTASSATSEHNTMAYMMCRPGGKFLHCTLAQRKQTFFFFFFFFFFIFFSFFFLLI